MRYTKRIPEKLFQRDGHYLGRTADFYDKIVTRRVKLVEAIQHFMGQEHSLLDIGCGNGASMFLLSTRMKRCVGMDITDTNKEEFDAFKQAHHMHNCEYRKVNVVEADATEQFDRIISFEVIEHLSDEDGVKFYYDSLTEDGTLAISVPNKWWIFETHGAKLPWLPWNRVPFFSWLPRPIHERFANARIYTKKRIRRLLEKHGFTVVNSYYITAPMDVLPEGKLKNWLIKHVFRTDVTRFPFKSTSIFVVAKKRHSPNAKC